MQQTFPWSEVSVYIAGHNGLVGSAIWRALESEGVGKLIGWRSAELDLCDRDATFDAINEAKPDVIIDAAAKVGGIMANSTYPVEFLRDNMLIQTNVMDAAHAANRASSSPGRSRRCLGLPGLGMRICLTGLATL